MRTTILATASAIAVAAAPLAAVAQNESASAQGQAHGQGQMMSQQSDGGIDVALSFLQDADVTGADGDEVGSIDAIVQSAGEQPGLYAVVNVDNGWFDEDTQIVKPLSQMTIVEDDNVRLDDVTEESIENEMTFVEEDWDIVEEEYASYEDAYEANDWDWW